MIVLTVVYYIILVLWYIINMIWRIPFFVGYDFLVGLLWLLNIFFIFYWNRKMWILFQLRFGEKLGYIIGSIILPFVMVPLIIFQIKKRKLW